MNDEKNDVSLKNTEYKKQPSNPQNIINRNLLSPFNQNRL